MSAALAHGYRPGRAVTSRILEAEAGANRETRRGAWAAVRCERGRGFLVHRKTGASYPAPCRSWRECSTCARAYGAALASRWSKVTGLAGFVVLTMPPAAGDWRSDENRRAMMRAWRRLWERICRLWRKVRCDTSGSSSTVPSSIACYSNELRPAGISDAVDVLFADGTVSRLSRSGLRFLVRLMKAGALCSSAVPLFARRALPSLALASEMTNISGSSASTATLSTRPKAMHFKEHAGEDGRLHLNLVWEIEWIEQHRLAEMAAKCGFGPVTHVSRIGREPVALAAGRAGSSAAVRYSSKQGFRVVAYARKTGSATAGAGDDWPARVRRWSATRAASREMGPRPHNPEWAWAAVEPRPSEAPALLTIALDADRKFEPRLSYDAWLARQRRAWAPRGPDGEMLARGPDGKFRIATE